MININTLSKALISTGLMAALFSAPLAQAAVSAEQAAELKNSLTPFGAERAGNAAGTIPAWQGGITQAPAGFEPGKALVDPYADDKVQFTITAANYKQYAANLTPGQQAMFERFPETFEMPVYQTRRSFAAPQWVYDNTYQNALNAKLAEGENGVQNAFGGVPFPIPQSGQQVIWNHQLRWMGQEMYKTYEGYTMYEDGSVRADGGEIWEDYPYYDHDAGLDNFDGNLVHLFAKYSEPARRKGEILLVTDPLDQTATARQAWQYIPGQRRVRRAPTVAYDTPSANGVTTYDDTYMYNGALDRYDWKLIGKEEIYIPYNNYKFMAAKENGYKAEDILQIGHPNPDLERWELHRVWVVEATLKDGKRHVYGKRTFYVDEDSWVVSFVDKYDNRGKLWRIAFPHLINDYQLPAVVMRAEINIDLLSNILNLSNYNLTTDWTVRQDSGFYSPSGVRKAALR
ncbi:TPA: DUF1329 domain-containing protein [Pseudomonas aeruginosa]|nr:DUF1329 domain-containing protein [Pseudomonas fluorescens]HBO1995414.1 DUF1329 domain-containing protein [Pseudomonas aeruginosa]